MQKITPFLWFNDDAEEAVIFYTSVFKNSKITNIVRYGNAGPGDKDMVVSVSFELEGQEFMAINGGPEYSFNQTISFFVKCDSQEEVDYFWEKLSEEGQKRQCGWVEDKFGLSWQIVPTVLGDLLRRSDRETSRKVMRAMLKMEKIDINGLEMAAGEK